MLARGEIQFVIVFPAGFSRAAAARRAAVGAGCRRRDRSAATGNAIAALSQAGATALAHDLTGSLAPLATAPAPFSLDRPARATTPRARRSTTSSRAARGHPELTMVMMTGVRDHARARARHVWRPARDAGAAARSDDGQDRARTSSSASSSRRSSCSRRGFFSACRWSAASRCSAPR